MLGQARQYISEDRSIDQSRCLLLRADVGRLPFATGSGEGRAVSVMPTTQPPPAAVQDPCPSGWNASLLRTACRARGPNAQAPTSCFPPAHAPNAVAAVHAGAAIHCWPNPQAALAEISRVLRPGGVFVASTFLNFTAPLGQLVGNDDLVAPLSQVRAAGNPL